MPASRRPAPSQLPAPIRNPNPMPDWNHGTARGFDPRFDPRFDRGFDRGFDRDCQPTALGEPEFVQWDGCGSWIVADEIACSASLWIDTEPIDESLHHTLGSPNIELT